MVGVPLPLPGGSLTPLLAAGAEATHIIPSEHGHQQLPHPQKHNQHPTAAPHIALAPAAPKLVPVPTAQHSGGHHSQEVLYDDMDAPGVPSAAMQHRHHQTRPPVKPSTHHSSLASELTPQSTDDHESSRTGSQQQGFAPAAEVLKGFLAL
ncbi:MAG: hypothetical protein WDW38_010769 [Sanguina aurantia]